MYFKIGDKDFSAYVNKLNITRASNYTSQTNAGGNTVVDYINSKRQIEVGIIPVDDTAMIELQLAISPFAVNVSFMNPKTNTLEENVACIIPEDSIDYYTIQAGKKRFNAFTLVFTEL